MHGEEEEAWRRMGWCIHQPQRRICPFPWKEAPGLLPRDLCGSAGGAGKTRGRMECSWQTLGCSDCLLGAAPAPEGSAHADGWSWSAWEQWPEQESLYLLCISLNICLALYFMVGRRWNADTTGEVAAGCLQGISLELGAAQLSDWAISKLNEGIRKNSVRF